MARRYKELKKRLITFIENQKVFFVGTAAPEGRVNVSPKGMDSLRVLGPNRVVWLNLTGSGNETAAHLLQSNRMTIMFCAFEGNPMILRLYGKTKIYHESDDGFSELKSLFPDHVGTRQIIDLELDMVQTSCGYGVPLMEFKEERTLLQEWGEAKSKEELRAYHLEKNTTSLDGFDTGLK